MSIFTLAFLSIHKICSAWLQEDQFCEKLFADEYH